MPALKILHVTESLGAGGAERNLLMLMSCAPPDVENHLAYFQVDDALKESFGRVATLHQLGQGGWIELPAVTWRLRELAKKLKPDVIHTQLLLSSFAGRVAAFGLSYPVVTTVQNAFYDGKDFGRMGGLTRRLMWGLDWVTGLRVSKHVAVSNYVRAHIQKQLRIPAEKIEVIPNCLDPSRLQPFSAEQKASVRRELNLGSGPVLIVLARLMEEKGQAEAISMMPKVLADFPDAKLLLVGLGGWHDRLVDLVKRMGLGASVVFAGRRSDVPLLLQASDLFVFPSRREGLPVAVIEGLAAGLPAVVGDIPQSREVGEGVKTCLFVSPTDVDALAAATLLLLKDPTARVRAQEAGRDIAHAFSAEVLAERFFSLCRNVATQG